MKKWMVLSAIALSGCTQITNYDQAVKTPAPAALLGVWQSMGPQSGLISPDAIATLIVTEQGDTLDCRQWQRVIAKPGKLTVRADEYVNVNKQLRVMPLDVENGVMYYDKLKLHKVDTPTAECQQALEAVQQQPDSKTIQNIAPEAFK
ncbi:lipoprotein [[Pantoea] beijingensis]|uniref:Lipoprotein n=1 Tax=[Pantoea] beijingensis TaxID=1324864 RepID=A0A443IIQ2_9GAMM|nr:MULTISPECIES: lipoprotein YedD [Erwiniaceae]RWR03903.1 lipoprotein [[Pantoea] beijingensis]